MQETKWKGTKARNIGGGYKRFHLGIGGKKNDVRIILAESLINSVLEVRRVSDMIIFMKIEAKGIILNVISAYAPQVGVTYV